ncbi:MAG: HNH endonuclease [Fischerella sp.]|nr:HNH endonuclease [Fischerella sp.]
MGYILESRTCFSSKLFELLISFQTRNSSLKLLVQAANQLSSGETNDISNLQTLCLTCNQKKIDHIDPRSRRYFAL